MKPCEVPKKTLHIDSILQGGYSADRSVWLARFQNRQDLNSQKDLSNIFQIVKRTSVAFVSFPHMENYEVCGEKCHDLS